MAFLKSFKKAAAAQLADKTIDGDLTITGDLKVEGGGSFTYDEIIEGTVRIQRSALSGFDTHDDDQLVIERSGDYSNLNLASDVGSYV